MPSDEVTGEPNPISKHESWLKELEARIEKLEGGDKVSPPLPYAPSPFSYAASNTATIDTAAIDTTVIHTEPPPNG